MTFVVERFVVACFFAAGFLALLGACAGIDDPPPPMRLPAAWSSSLPASAPTSGRAVELRQWWQQFDDPRVAELVEQAERASPDLSAARARIAQARAARVAAGAALVPAVNANVSAQRGRIDLFTPQGRSVGASLGASWELDLFGADRAARDAAQARLEGAEAGWHQARVSVAAETGLAYLALRACEAQRIETRLDAASRDETARLAGLSVRAGFQAPADGARARADAAQGHAAVERLQAQCDGALQSLAALTAQPAEVLRPRLAASAARLPEPTQFNVTTVPAQALAQRPDVAQAGRDLLAAQADAAQAKALRYPTVSLAGSIGATRLSGDAGSVSATTWSVGPVTVSLPVFDGGTRRARAEAAEAQHEAAKAAYSAVLRSAIREVEQALIDLRSTTARGADARIAVDGFEQSLRATEARHRSGLASLFELEEARRSASTARAAWIDLRRERVAAWIALYRALGGGWTPAEPVAAPSPSRPTAPEPTVSPP